MSPPELLDDPELLEADVPLDVPLLPVDGDPVDDEVPDEAEAVEDDAVEDEAVVVDPLCVEVLVDVLEAEVPALLTDEDPPEVAPLDDVAERELLPDEAALLEVALDAVTEPVLSSAPPSG